MWCLVVGWTGSGCCCWCVSRGMFWDSACAALLPEPAGCGLCFSRMCCVEQGAGLVATFRATHHLLVGTCTATPAGATGDVVE